MTMREFLQEHNIKRLEAYRSMPRDLNEHWGIEQVVLAGGYGYRQVMELIQNGADAILESIEGPFTKADNLIHVSLRGARLYVANTGAPLNIEGMEALLSSHSSHKRGNQIGRFGLGFKSLLGLGGNIDLFTKGSGGIRFDPKRCRRELTEEFNAHEVPGLRLAWPIDDAERSADPVLDQFSWAETIVRVEISKEEFIPHLGDEIRGFPSEFLLFMPISIRLLLDDGINPVREMRAEPQGSEVTLFSGKEEARWQVVTRDVTITDERARADATHIHARDTVPLAWAMPLGGKREESGRFWAFFPTHTQLYLPGILNAPWKLNSDRNAIIGGDWNTALMREAARLIANFLPELRTDADPGRTLDAFPRQLDRKDDDAAPLIEALWCALETAAVVPDTAGNLRSAVELWRHPQGVPEVIRRWQALAGSREQAEMVHPSCLERQRGSRLNALAERLKPQEGLPALRNRLANAWFAAVASADVERAVEVLRLAEAYEKEAKSFEWSPVQRSIAIIPSVDGQLVVAGQAVFAPEGTTVPIGRHIVATSLVDDDEAKRILVDVMKVQAIDDSVWEGGLRELLSSLGDQQTGQDAGWRSFWHNLRISPVSAQKKFFAAYRDKIRIRRRDGRWVKKDEILLPGTLIHTDDVNRNQWVLVDLGCHSEDMRLLKELGLTECPEGSIDLIAYDGFQEWRDYFRHLYKQKFPSSARWDYLRPIQVKMPSYFDVLPHLFGEAKSKLTEIFLSRLSKGEFGQQVVFGHYSMPSYTRIYVPHPLPWFLLKNGTLQIGGEVVSLSAIVARRNEIALTKLTNWQEKLNWLNLLRDVFPPVVSTQDHLSTFWQALVKELATTKTTSDEFFYELWAGAAKDNWVPETLLTEEGEIPLSQVFVTGSRDLAKRAGRNGCFVVVLDDCAFKLWIKNGARNLTELMTLEIEENTGPQCLLISMFPDITEVLREDERDSASCQPVAGLKLNIAGKGHSVPCLLWEGILFVDSWQLMRLSRAKRLHSLVVEVASAGWLQHESEEALRILGDAQVDTLRASIAKGSTLAERLLLAVGNHKEHLQQALGPLASMDFVLECSGLQLAELVLAQLGPTTLIAVKDALAAEGLNPPRRWNTAEARAFVASIGFPLGFALSAEVRRDSEESISGPIPLPQLHDFQVDVLEGIKCLLPETTTRRRAVVSLPTGGGKTRVTVEAAVMLVLKPEGRNRSVIWVAQTDELCEQAVQAFRQVWLNRGAEKIDLRIVRLWGGNPNPSIQDPDKPVVVVASIQTLNSRMGTERLSWLQKPGLVVVDECHHAITPSYTNLLRWLDAEAPRPGGTPKDEPPIIGLSATPFRTDDTESQRLAKRFDNLWLPMNQEDLHIRLRNSGVLAEVDTEGLDSGVSLLPEEMEQLSMLSEPWEGIEFENIIEAINRRLAGNKQRNDRLVNRISAAEERSILLFANSVLHAEEISARLNLAGIASASVSGSTPTSARRYFLEKFQKGELRVLCNHSVLTTGFDAPKTDMVLISRAIFSPVRYMQIVGRGLRGEKNGGTARCRIVTVMDNLGRFQDRHPYHYCQKYFTSKETLNKFSGYNLNLSSSAFR